MKCQCEHRIHDDDGQPNGCGNVASIRISPSWIICTACEATMDVYDHLRPGLLACTNTGKYAGQTWHAGLYAE